MSSKLTVLKDKKGNIDKVVIKDVTFYYPCISRPKAIYDDRKLPYDKARKEYSVQIGVNEDVADAWDELFDKQNAKKMSNEKFIEQFQLKAEEGGDVNKLLPEPKAKRQYVIKVAQKAEKNDGTPISDNLVPRVLVPDEKDPKKLVDVTFEKLVGNGSKGHIIIRVNSNADYGTFAYLSRMIVTDLIEYEVTSVGGLSEEEADLLGFDTEIELAEVPEANKSEEQAILDAADDTFDEEDV